MRVTNPICVGVIVKKYVSVSLSRLTDFRSSNPPPKIFT
jgi:hypothetical protein